MRGTNGVTRLSMITRLPVPNSVTHKAAHSCLWSHNSYIIVNHGLYVSCDTNVYLQWDTAIGLCNLVPDVREWNDVIGNVCKARGAT